MLRLEVETQELWNAEINQFIPPVKFVLELEHSLVSISKWEETWEIPFLGNAEKTNVQVLDYVRCMTLNKDVDPAVYHLLSASDLDDINRYINAKRSATWFGATPDKPGRNEIITSEVVYYWLVTGQIDFQVQYWHFSRLMTLIKVIGDKQNTGKAKSKMSPAQLAARNRDLNAKRKAELGTKG